MCCALTVCLPEMHMTACLQCTWIPVHIVSIVCIAALEAASFTDEATLCAEFVADSFTLDFYLLVESISRKHYVKTFILYLCIII